MIWAMAILCGGAMAAPEPVQFQPAAGCALCHSRIPPPDGASSGVRSVAPYALWAGAMKAHSARDPFWKAKVRSETALTPAAAAIIEDKCLRCHAPAQHYPLRVMGRPMRMADLDASGTEGVTCTVCHQISPDGLGRPESFTGGFLINGRRQIYGPHERPFLMPMLHHTGYEARASAHVLESALCATCHTVITPSLDANGKVIGEFVEQAPFLEWMASAHAREGRTCQSCHMPVLKDAQGRLAEQYIAHRPPGGPFPPTRPRAPFGLHVFAGGNVRLPLILAGEFPDEAAVLRESSDRAHEQLKRSVALSLTSAIRRKTLRIRVTVANRAGHKLPTAYPSRRMWLHVAVRDADGAPVFETADPGAGFQPHRRTITRPDEVMVYEAEYQDSEGRLTTSLLRATGYLKDNRILPRGFQPRDPAIQPSGVDGDPDFVPGADTVDYEIGIEGHRAPFRIAVEARFESVKPSHDPSYSGAVVIAGAQATSLERSPQLTP